MDIQIKKQDVFSDELLEIGEHMETYCLADVSGTIEYNICSYRCPYCKNLLFLGNDINTDIVTCNFCSGILKLEI